MFNEKCNKLDLVKLIFPILIQNHFFFCKKVLAQGEVFRVLFAMNCCCKSHLCNYCRFYYFGSMTFLGSELRNLFQQYKVIGQNNSNFLQRRFRFLYSCVYNHYQKNKFYILCDAELMSTNKNGTKQSSFIQIAMKQSMDLEKIKALFVTWLKLQTNN